MPQKKEEQSEKKPGVKVQDLPPSKDAKGGAARNTNSGPNLDGNRNLDSSRNTDSARNQNSARNLD